MKHELIISSEAQIDSVEIADWYELQTTGTGERFTRLWRSTSK